MPEHYIAIEIGGTKLQVFVGDAQARVIARQRFSVDSRRGAEGIRRQIELALPEIIQRFQPSAVGVGFGGPVQWRTGRIARSHQVEGWSDFDFGSWLASLTNIPLCIDNDANMAALGEARCGAGKGANPVFYVTLGSGVGGGLVVDERIYHGAAPGESEIGHVRLDRAGTIVEERCSGWAVDSRVREAAQSGGFLQKLVGEASGGEARFLVQAVVEGDPSACRILREAAEHLAFGLSHVTHLMHPEAIVLGGGLSLLGEPLRRAVSDLLPRMLMEVFRPGPSVRLAGLGEDSVPVGCLLAARELPFARR